MKRKKDRAQIFSRRQFLQASAMTLAGGILAACSPDRGSSVEAIPTALPDIDTSEPITITMWYSAPNHESEYKARQAEIEEKFNVRMNFELFNQGDIETTLRTVLMAGNGIPDIYESYRGTFNSHVRGTDADIPFLSLTDVFTGSPYHNQVLESRLALYTKDGQLYGFPRDVHPQVLLYHEMGWQEYGIDMAQVETWDDFLAACAVVGANATMPDGRRRYCIMDLPNGGTMATLLAQNGIWWTNEKDEPILNTPLFKQVVETWWQLKEYWVNIDWENQVNMFKEGQFLAQITPDWLFGIHKQGTLEDTDWLANSPIRMKTVPGGPTTGSWGGTGAGVLKRSPHARKAVEILLYLYFENGQNQLETRFVETGVLPPVTNSWQGDSFQVPEPFVGGQVAGQIFADAAGHIPSYNFDWKAQLVSTAWEEQANMLWADEINDLDEAIATAYANALAEIEKNSSNG